MHKDDPSDLNSSKELIDIIKREFSGVDRPITAEELARLYGVMAAQHEATLACFALIMKANPRLVLTDESSAAAEAMEKSVQALSGALIDLAKSSMSDEDRASIEAEND